MSKYVIPRSCVRLTAAICSSGEPYTIRPAVGPHPKPISETLMTVLPRVRCYMSIHPRDTCSR